MEISRCLPEFPLCMAFRMHAPRQRGKNPFIVITGLFFGITALGRRHHCTQIYLERAEISGFFSLISFHSWYFICFISWNHWYNITL